MATKHLSHTFNLLPAVKCVIFQFCVVSLLGNCTMCFFSFM